MASIFISYRRRDSQGITGRIFDHLETHLGEDKVFYDVDSIPSAVNFIRYIEKTVEVCQVMVVVIGPYWLSIANPDGSRRLDDPDDYVRLEIEHALKLRIPILPVLIGDTTMPPRKVLPESISEIASLNGHTVDPGRDFRFHAKRLADELQGLLDKQDEEGSSAALNEWEVRQHNLKRSREESRLARACDQAWAGMNAGVGQEDKLFHERERELGAFVEFWGERTYVIDGETYSVELAPVVEAERAVYTLSHLPRTVELTEGPLRQLADCGQREFERRITRRLRVFSVPLTQEGYEGLIGDNPSRGVGESLPVELVSWYDAVRFCNRLSALMGLPKAYSFDPEDPNRVYWENPDTTGWRLPTEAEWEYLARSGYGDLSVQQLDALAWHAENSDGQTQPVGGKGANEWGLYDVLGNVWEWCWDWYDDYDETVVDDPSGPLIGRARVYRGGSADERTRRVSFSVRGRAQPGFRCSHLGFRPVRTLP